MQSGINRRNIFRVAAAGLAASALPAMALAAGPPLDPRLLALEQIIADLIAATLLPDDQADAAMDKAEIALEHLMDEIYAGLSSPPTQTDLALCGRMAEYWAYRAQGGCDSSEERAVNQLIHVTLAAAGLKPLANATKTAETVADFISLMGGTAPIADFCGVSNKEVERWGKRNLIPVGWRSRLSAFASRRHVRIAQALMEA